MPHSKRTCRLSSKKQNPRGRSGNYNSDKVAQKAIKKKKMAKQARKRNRKRK